MDTSHSGRESQEREAGEGQEEEEEHCSSLDRIMCQIVDELNCDMD